MIRILLLKIVRDLRASLAQSIALMSIVALGIASLVATVGAYRDLGTSYNHTYRQLHLADATIAVQSAPEAAVQDVAQTDGVAAVTGRLVVDTGLELAGGRQIRARLIGIDPGRHAAVNDVLVLKGSFLSPSDPNAALLESHFAKEYGLNPGATVTPLINGEKVPLTVAGIAASPEYLIVSPSKQEILPSARTFCVLFVPRAMLQKLVGAEGTVNELSILVDANADRDAVIQRVRSRLEPYGIVSVTLQEDQPSAAALRLDLEGYREIAALMPAVILLMAGVSLYVMLGRQVRAHRPQIGLMKALGYSSRAVMGYYLGLALTIGLAGSVVGLAAGLPLAHVLTTGYAGELGIPLVQTRFYPDVVLLGVVFSLVATALGGIGPARSSAGIAPAAAMRLDPAGALVKGRVSFVERLVSLPIWLRLPLRNVFRVRRRSLSTAVGIVFSFILVLAGWGMIDSIEGLLLRTFSGQEWNEAVTFNSLQTAATLDQVTSWEGVQQIAPVIQSPATLKAGGREEDILLTALLPDRTMGLVPLSGDKDLATALGPGQIVLTSAMAGQLHLHPGDEVTVDLPTGSQSLTVSGTTDELMSANAYAGLAEAQDWLGAPGAALNGLYLRVDASHSEAVRDQLYHLPGAASVRLKSEVEADWRSLMGLFYAIMGAMLAFAVAMAFALLFNAMTVNVLEREREFATMRAMGTGSRTIALLLTGESLVLWLLCLVPGLILGWWVAVQMGAAFQSDLFSFNVTIAPASYAVTALGILLTMILAAVPAIRRVGRLNLAEATKVLT